MPAMSPASPWHLNAQLGYFHELLGRYLCVQRGRGRTPAADAVRGYVIEDGEAEGLLAELGESLARSRLVLSRTDHPSRDGPTGPATIAEPECPDGEFFPLRHAARAFDLGHGEYLALLAALAVESDARFGRLVAYLNDHVGRTRPTVGLALALAELDGTEEWIAPAVLCERPVVRDGLLELEGDGPLPGLSLRLARDLLPRLLSDAVRAPDVAGVRYHPPEDGRLGRLILEDAHRQRLVAWAERLGRGEPAPALILSGAAGSGRATAGRAAVAEAGLATVTIECDAGLTPDRLRLGRREARWYGAALLLRLRPEAPVDWRAVWEGLDGLPQPIVMALPPESVEPATASAPVEPVVIALAEPSLSLRADLWRVLLPPGADVEAAELDQLAGRFRFGPGRIARAIRRAGAEAALRPPEVAAITPADLGRACRELGSATMGPLAQKLPLPFERDDLVVPASLQAELDLAIAWLRQQGRVLHDWGFGRRVAMGRGLTALFTGPPGTGKTMAAQVLARALDLDLYRVDLSRVMSKWIGETEKNLGRLFDETQASGAVLFFDEADALFGKRTEVKDAHDRYANVEIGYLLQRMEEHEGVTVLASNRAADMDDAFLRRFQFLLNFPSPDEGMRRRIWAGMFPPAVDRDPDLDLARLAAAFELSGGEIRNVVLAAAFLAADEARPLGMSHVVRSIAREFRKGGKLLDERKLRGL